MLIRYTNKIRAVVVLLAFTWLAGCNQAGSLATTQNDSAGISVTNGETDNTNGGGVVTLNWMPPLQYEDGTALTDLKIYNIYYGSSPNSLNNVILNVSSEVSSIVIENLQNNTEYYFAITAVNSSDIESNLSNIITKYVSG